MDPYQSVPGAVSPVQQGVPQFVDSQPDATPEPQPEDAQQGGVPQFAPSGEEDAAGIGAAVLDGQPGAQQTDPMVEWQRQQIMQQQYALMQQAQVERQQREYLEGIALQQYISQLPPDQAEIAKRIYVYNKQQEAVQQRLAYERDQAMQYAQMAEQASLPMLKRQALTELSQKYGIERSLLEQTNSRAEAENLAKALSTYKKKSAFATRQQTKVDSIPQSSGQANSGVDLSEVNKQYKNSGRIAKYITELRRRGQWD